MPRDKSLVSSENLIVDKVFVRVVEFTFKTIPSLAVMKSDPKCIRAMNYTVKGSMLKLFVTDSHVDSLIQNPLDLRFACPGGQPQLRSDRV